MIRKLLFVIILLSCITELFASGKRWDVKALYIALADHYAAIVAYEKYHDIMKYASFSIKKIANWDLLSAEFRNQKADMAFVMAPLAVSMYQEKAFFKWIGLMHRDGSAMAINNYLANQMKYWPMRKDRKPNKEVAAMFYPNINSSWQLWVAVPHLYSTHVVMLYKFLKDHNITLDYKPNRGKEVLAIAIPPEQSSAFMKRKSALSIPSAFVQSLPWAEVVENESIGKITWYSKDVLPTKNGHVECIALASNKALRQKYKAIKEVMDYIKKAANDIEVARKKGGLEIQKIVNMIQKHMPLHTEEAIRAALDNELRSINYKHLDIDKEGLDAIIKLAISAGILHENINLEDFSDMRFNKPLEVF